MAWTSADLLLIENAIRGALSGKVVSFGGKTWTAQTIGDLMQLRQAIQSELAQNDDAAAPTLTMTPTVRGW